MVSLIIASYEVEPYHEEMMEKEEKRREEGGNGELIYEAMKVMVSMPIPLEGMIQEDCRTIRGTNLQRLWSSALVQKVKYYGIHVYQ